LLLQVATRKDGRKKGPQHKESGVRAAARELGVDKDEAHRSVIRL
jgi:hypothetical protein